VANHIGVLIKSQVLHDVKNEKVEPLGDIDRLIVVTINNLKELINCLGDSRIVPEKCYPGLRVSDIPMNVDLVMLWRRSLPLVLNP
jgi:hypothetical protein